MNKQNGFTLIELLIVITIISILLMIAYPSYQNMMTQSRRADAKAALQGLAQAMEHRYTTAGTYTGAASGGVDTGAPAIFSAKAPIDGSEIIYNLRIVSAGVSTYLIGAEPIGIQSGDGVLILRSTGARGWDANDSANGNLSSLGSAPNEVESTEWCWKTDC